MCALIFLPLVKLFTVCWCPETCRGPILNNSSKQPVFHDVSTLKRKVPLQRSRLLDSSVPGSKTNLELKQLLRKIFSSPGYPSQVSSHGLRLFVQELFISKALSKQWSIFYWWRVVTLWDKNVTESPQFEGKPIWCLHNPCHACTWVWAPEMKF